MYKIPKVVILYWVAGLLCESLSSKCPPPSTSEYRFVGPVVGSEYVVFNCPNRKSAIELTIYKKEKVTLNCLESPYQYINFLPSINLSTWGWFQLERCMLNVQVIDILQKLHMRNLKDLTLANIISPSSLETVTVTKELFTSLRRLEWLSIRQGEFKLMENFLENTPNILDLTLNSAELEEIGMHFNPLRKLKRLDLSMNRISRISNGAFKQLHNLTRLYLNNNNISALREHLFEGLTSLETLDISANTIRKLEENSFEELVNLREINLAANNIREIPQNIFKKCNRLENISLHKNQLSTLPEALFSGLKSLRQLDLSCNELTQLNEKLFSSLTSLKISNLSHNKLQIIDIGMFQNLVSLRILKIAYNMVTAIKDSRFTNLNNPITTYHGRNDFSNLTLNQLVMLDLGHNKIDQYPEISRLRIKKLGLNFNEIDHVKVESLIDGSKSTIDLSNNRIKRVDFPLLKYLLNRPFHYRVDVKLDNNPIECSCSNYNLVLYNHGQLKEMNARIMISQKNILCSKSNRNFFTDIEPDDVECPISHDCPQPCACVYKPHNGDATVNCSSTNLTVVPALQNVLKLNKTEAPAGHILYYKYVNVANLDLSNNLLTEINWIPSGLKELNLNDNKVKHLNKNFISLLNNTHTLGRVYLKGNPWECDCEAWDLQNYLMEHFDKEVNVSDVYCQNVHTALVDIENLCKFSPFISIVLPNVLGILLFFAIVFVILYRYRNEIKIYLYAKNLCLRCITEEELDLDKTYDVFLSYAEPDEEFVVKQLLPELENEEKPFKVCIHIRDGLAGEFITNQIFNSVKNSRRTLVILSNNFLESVWGKLEFRTAHSEGITQGRTRVIVVIYGDLNEENLDEELKHYMKTNTYVKWGDKYFWHKLKFALPHSRNLL